MIREDLLSQIWKHRLVRQNALMTADGKRVEVLFPGRANSDSGPDFCDALVILGDGGVLKGDVEVHVCSRDWQAHGHHKDVSYNGVVLHVVMWNDGREVSMLQSGGKAPILELAPYLSQSIEELQQSVESSVMPSMPCRQRLDKYGGDEVDGLLRKAGEERFHSKVARFRAKLACYEPETVFYEGTMRALGYAKNKGPFEELARLLPLAILRPLAARGALLDLQALMLGKAGLLPAQRRERGGSRRLSEWDEPEVERLQQVWMSLGIEETRHLLDWRFFRVRPDNFPTRRIIAASYLVSVCRGDLLGDALTRVSQSPVAKVQKEMEKGFMLRAGGYWACHYDFGFETRCSTGLIGRGRAREIVVNVFLPFLYAWAERQSQPWLKEKAIQIYRDHPPLAENWITRYVRRQVLGEDRCVGASACCQQGLIHLYEAFCVDQRCHCCPLG
ncbi:MAG: hypothetical protein A2Y91_03715 [Chloroflexi bacterium RBG_13_54_8]|nr:MAG: hypothetical protein A2Y91_03715 [Chloroflexi bacterium RBG_13_54_8]